MATTKNRVEPTSSIAPHRERNGAVYTKEWVVELMLDLSGYTVDRPLSTLIIVEPASGDGSFVLPIVDRLIASCRLFDQSIDSARSALIAYELSPERAQRCRAQVQHRLVDVGVDEFTASELAACWVVTGDFLLSRPALPRVDFVIGNPPYIRLEDIHADLVGRYRRLYPTMVGRADLYIAFYEAALRQLKAGGVCSYICADRWMLNQYGSQLRQFITDGFAVDRVIEVHRADAFQDEVSAYPAITVIRSGAQEEVAVARINGDGASLGSQQIQASLAQSGLNGAVKAARIQSWFAGSDPWPCYNPERLALLKRLESDFYPLDSKGTGTRSGIGVASGADGIFLTDDPDLVEPERLLPLALAKDIRSGHLEWSGNYLINPWSGRGLVSLDHYPRLRAHLQQNEEVLRSRHVGKRNPAAWYRTIDIVEPSLINKPKLLIADIRERLNPVLDRGTTYPHHNLYFIQSVGWDHEVLGGLLLSDVAQFFIECYGVRMRGGYLRFQAQYLRRIRVPRPQDVTIDQAHQLRKAFQSRDIHLATEIAMRIYGIEHLPEDDY